MQQTTQYKLNKPDLDDNIAIAPLNENADKIEAAILAETAARQSADAAETSARQSAIAAEAQARADADAAEIQARQSAIASEAQARQSAIASEAVTRQSAIASEAQTRAAADTSETQARQSADAALEQRIAVLELHKFVAGTYLGNGSTVGDAQTINLGFTPAVVIMEATISGGPRTVVCVDSFSSVMQIVPGGFTVKYMITNTTRNTANTNGTTYRYAAMC